MPQALIQEQLAAYRRTFRLPDDLLVRVIALYDQAPAECDDMERQWQVLINRMERINDMYA